MPTPPIALVFTDLDNTLYDWVAWYSRALYRLVGRASQVSGVPQRQLLQEMQTIYRDRDRLEEPEALLHAPSIQAAFGDPLRAQEVLSAAFKAYYHADYGPGLHPYAGVRSTLQRFAAANIMLVGHTEAPANHAVARLRALGLEHAFVCLLAGPASANDPTLGDADVDDPPFPVLTLAPEETKPNPTVLQRWCERWSIPPQAALYVGDSLDRDIQMAQAAGLQTAWARYGTQHDPRDWARVAEVSPWSPARRARPRGLVSPTGPRPQAILEYSFDELLHHFSFGATPQAPVVTPSIAVAAQ